MVENDGLEAVRREIEAGLPNERGAIDQAWLNCEYYHLRGVHHIQMRDAENSVDFAERPKVSLPLTPRVVHCLTEHLYAPGPSRQIAGDPAATKWLNGVYADNLANSLLQRADRMSTLNGYCAVQAAYSGNPMRPVKLQLWGREQLAVFCDPRDCLAPIAVVTIERFDETTHYTMWTAAGYEVYSTRKLGVFQTAGGRMAEYRPELSGEHPYGVVPFAFLHYELPTSGFETAGIGTYLSELNAVVDTQASDLMDAIRRYHTPTGVAYDADIEFQPIVQPGKFLRVNSIPSDLETAPTPRLAYLQANLDISGGWESIRQAINAALEGLGVPMTAYRMDQAQIPSGIALVAEQAPLLSRARERQEPFRLYETQLAKLVLRVGRKFASRAADLDLLLAWPEPSIPIPGPDRDAADQAEIALGLSSVVMIAMRRYGLTREQAIEHLRQVANDHAALSSIFPSASGDAAEVPDPVSDVAGSGEGDASGTPSAAAEQGRGLDVLADDL